MPSQSGPSMCNSDTTVNSNILHTSFKSFLNSSGAARVLSALHATSAIEGTPLSATSPRCCFLLWQFPASFAKRSHSFVSSAPYDRSPASTAVTAALTSASGVPAVSASDSSRTAALKRVPPGAGPAARRFHSCLAAVRPSDRWTAANVAAAASPIPPWSAKQQTEIEQQQPCGCHTSGQYNRLHFERRLQ